MALLDGLVSSCSILFILAAAGGVGKSCCFDTSGVGKVVVLLLVD